MNELTITKFLSAFFRVNEEIRLLVYPRNGDAGYGCPTTLEKLQKDESLQETLKEDDKTSDIYFFANFGGISDDQITRYNAFFVEIDKSGGGKHLLLDKAPIQPNIRVEDKNSIQAYWLNKENCSKEDWINVQEKLIAYFSGDTFHSSPASYIRLPFFRQVFFDGKECILEEVRIVAFDSSMRFTVEEMKIAFSTNEVFDEGQSNNEPVFEDVSSTSKEHKSISKHIDFKNNESRENTEDEMLDAQGSETECPEHSNSSISELGKNEESSWRNKTFDEGISPSLDFICFADVEEEEVHWLWFPYIAIGKLTVITGEEGLGKSWLTCAFASAVSNGHGFPLSDAKFEPGNVLMLSAEDGLGDTIKPRLVSLNANQKRIFALNESLTLDEKGFALLEKNISRYKPKMMIIDPLFAYTPAKTDVNSTNQSRAVSAPLAALAAKHNCAIVFVRHVGKSKGLGDSRAAGLGSIDWRVSVRSELLIGKNPNNEHEKAIIQTKHNLGKLGDAIGFVIGDSANGASFRWTGKSNLTPEDILSIPEQKRSGGGMSKAESFLLDALEDGERPASEVLKEAREVGLSEQNLRTARMKLSVKKRKSGNPHTGEQKWLWRLPDDMSLI